MLLAADGERFRIAAFTSASASWVAVDAADWMERQEPKMEEPPANE